MFEVKDKDTMEDDLIANGSLLIDQIKYEGDATDVPLTVDLLEGGSPVGQLFLKFTFIPDDPNQVQKEMQQIPQSKGNGRLLIKPIAADLSESG